MNTNFVQICRWEFHFGKLLPLYFKKPNWPVNYEYPNIEDRQSGGNLTNFFFFKEVQSKKKIYNRLGPPMRSNGLSLISFNFLFAEYGNAIYKNVSSIFLANNTSVMPCYPIITIFWLSINAFQTLHNIQQNLFKRLGVKTKSRWAVFL